MISEAGLEAIGVEPDNATDAAHSAPAAGEDAPCVDEGDGAVADAPAAPRAPKTRAGTKQAKLIALLREGATIDEMVAATGWQSHTVRGAMASALKKRLGLAIASKKEERGRVYRIVD
jgi:hypothetical protein